MYALSAVQTPGSRGTGQSTESRLHTIRNHDDTRQSTRIGCLHMNGGAILAHTTHAHTLQLFITLSHSLAHQGLHSRGRAGGGFKTGPGEFSSSQKRRPRLSYPGPRLPPELLSFVVASSPGEGARGAHAAGHSPSPEAKPYTHRHQSCAASGDDARRYPHGDSPSSQKAFQYAIAAAPAAANAAACQRAYCNSSKSVNEPPVSRSCQAHSTHCDTRAQRGSPAFSVAAGERERVLADEQPAYFTAVATVSRHRLLRRAWRNRSYSLARAGGRGHLSQVRGELGRPELRRRPRDMVVDMHVHPRAEPRRNRRELLELVGPAAEDDIDACSAPTMVSQPRTRALAAEDDIACVLSHHGGRRLVVTRVERRRLALRRRGSEGFRGVPRGSEGVRGVPRGSEGVREGPRGSEGVHKVGVLLARLARSAARLRATRGGCARRAATPSPPSPGA